MSVGRRATPLFEGYLEKQQSRGLKTWQPRYFVLLPGRLNYHKKPGEPVSETIAIQSNSSVAQGSRPGEFIFKQEPNDREYRLRCFEEPGQPPVVVLCERWMAVLREQIHNMGASAVAAGAMRNPTLDDTAAPTMNFEAECHVWEYKRYVPLRGWVAPMLPTDPCEWASDQNGREPRRRDPNDCCWPPSDCQCAPAGPRQLSPWQTDYSGRGTWSDQHGWQYSWTFPTSDSWSKSNRPMDTVRRRRWIRVRSLAPEPVPTSAFHAFLAEASAKAVAGDRQRTPGGQNFLSPNANGNTQYVNPDFVNGPSSTTSLPTPARGESDGARLAALAELRGTTVQALQAEMAAERATAANIASMGMMNQSMATAGLAPPVSEGGPRGWCLCLKRNRHRRNSAEQVDLVPLGTVDSSTYV